MTPTRRKIHGTAAAAVLLAALGGCASVPPPTAELDAADSAIHLAASPAAQHYAADELETARHELADAQAAAAQQDYAQARALAAAAQADADLIRAKTRALSGQADVAAKTDENETLRRRLLDQEPLR
jgi:hypothetical protein